MINLHVKLTVQLCKGGKMMEEQQKSEYIDIYTGAVYSNANSAMQAKLEKEREEESDKNPPFYQLSKGIGPVTLAKISEKSTSAISVLMFFFENMDNYNTLMVSQQVIAEEIGKARQTISNAIKVLEDESVIGIGKVGQSNVYMINPKIVWQNGNRQRRSMNIKGNILLGESENKELFKKFNNIDTSKSFKTNNITTKVSKS